MWSYHPGDDVITLSRLFVDVKSKWHVQPPEPIGPFRGDPLGLSIRRIPPCHGQGHEHGHYHARIDLSHRHSQGGTSAGCMHPGASAPQHASRIYPSNSKEMSRRLHSLHRTNSVASPPHSSIVAQPPHIPSVPYHTLLLLSQGRGQIKLLVERA